MKRCEDVGRPDRHAVIAARSGSGIAARSALAIAVVAVAAIAGCAAPGGAAGAGPATASAYEVWVASEAVDEIALIRFDGRDATVARRRGVGMVPVEVDGPHGIALSPDARFIYVTLGHGLPYGTLIKIDAETDRVVGRTTLGLFPATVDVTPDGEYAFVSNFNLHGDHVPSSISMVHLATMMEVGRTETCVMPHGSRVDPTGERHYSVCMMDEELIELDAATAQLRRTLALGPAEPHHHTDGDAGLACSPTWAEPSADGTRVYVTCNRAAEVLEVDVERWEIVRRFATGESPYNIAVTPDGSRMVVTLRNRTDPALEIHDLRTGSPAGRVALSTTLGHGVVVTEDSRLAFVSVEGIGSEPGRVDVIDIAAARRVASVPVGQQATGIALVPSAAR